MKPTPSIADRPPQGARVEPVRIGYVPLADSAPLIAADELGLFEKHGVAVELHREVGWATIREKIFYHELDAAHAPAGLAISLRLGTHGLHCASLAPFIFNANGNAVTLSTALYERGVQDARSLRMLIRSTPQRLFTFGVVALCSSHNILLRTWLEQGGICPDEDVRIVMLPPAQMPSALASGLLDGYCAGEPWNSAAVATGAGWCPATSETIAPGHPEKILLTTEEFASTQEDTLLRIIRALYEACAYCDIPANRKNLIPLLSAAFRNDRIRDLLELSLVGPFQTGLAENTASQFHIFHRNEVNRPVGSQATWLMTNLIDHGVIPKSQRGEVQEALRACWTSHYYDLALNPAAPTAVTPSPKRKSRPRSLVKHS